ncbi:hypothetical protein [Mesonia sp.]|uniref:hypothetical protein n=1 Tax=Mesonia sp. TaxID=1960830 RepID=UPI003F9BD0F8
MKTFLSILSIKTNNFSNEKIVVGLLAVSANQVFYAYSKDKLKVLNKISHQDNLSNFAESILNQIKKKIDKTNKENFSFQESLSLKKELFSEEYFNYLSNYNNGILNFSKPYEINYLFSTLDFEKYYKNFVGALVEPENKEIKLTLHKKIKPYFDKKGLEEKADLNYTLHSANFKGVLQDCQIPLITKNGNINALQAIDFNMHPNTITHHLYETKIIFDALSNFAPKINSSVDKIKIAFEEPKLKSKQHILLDLALKEYKDIFKFISPDKVDSFTDKILNSKNSKFSSFI